MQSISEVLDVNRESKKPFALKAERTLHRVTFNPSSANPGESLYVHLPKLSDNRVYVPGTVGLTFDLNLPTGTDSKNTLVNNISRNLVLRMRVLYGGEILQDTDRMDVYQTYNDLFQPKKDRENMLREGVSTLNMRRHRTASTEKDSDAKDTALAAIYGKKYRIAINHPILDGHGAFYARALSNTLTFEITLPESKDIAHIGASTTYGYTLSNIELEYECILSEHLANEAIRHYNVGKGFYYENVLLHKTFTIAKATDSVINEHINIPRRSMTGILMLFTEPYVTGARDSEKFVYPALTGVNINVDGMPNKLFSKGMLKTDFWSAIVKKMGVTDNVAQKDFYSDKFALWVDLRTYQDKELHGSGLMLNSTKDGVKLELKRTTSGSGNINCHVFVVADAVMEVENADLKTIFY